MVIYLASGLSVFCHLRCRFFCYLGCCFFVISARMGECPNKSNIVHVHFLDVWWFLGIFCYLFGHLFVISPFLEPGICGRAWRSHTETCQIQLTHNRNDAATWHEHDNIKITKWQNTKKQTYFQYFQILTWVTHNVWIRCLLRTWAGAIRFAHPGQLHTELGSGLHLVEARLIHRLITSFLVGNFRVLDDLDMRMVRA